MDPEEIRQWIMAKFIKAGGKVEEPKEPSPEEVERLIEELKQDFGLIWPLEESGGNAPLGKSEGRDGEEKQEAG